MTFPANLERLLKEAKEPSIKGELINFNAVIAKQKLALLLHNHADAILGLVRAAEALRDGLPEQDPYASELVAALAEALAKLNGEQEK